MPLVPPVDLELWLGQNEALLCPPINNLCIQSGKDFVVMLVGGPNARNDFHINQTEVSSHK